MTTQEKLALLAQVRAEIESAYQDAAKVAQIEMRAKLGEALSLFFRPQAG
jgi:hypothetical protein